MQITFYDNGQTTAFDDKGEQVGMAQKPWLMAFIEHLESEGFDPTESTYIMPNGKKAKVFHTEGGYNWMIGT